MDWLKVIVENWEFVRLSPVAALTCFALGMMVAAAVVNAFHAREVRNYDQLLKMADEKAARASDDAERYRAIAEEARQAPSAVLLDRTQRLARDLRALAEQVQKQQIDAAASRAAARALREFNGGEGYLAAARRPQDLAQAGYVHNFRATTLMIREEILRRLDGFEPAGPLPDRWNAPADFTEVLQIADELEALSTKLLR